MLADCLLSQDDITLIKKKDYIKNPKPGGYRSLHLIISIPIFLQEGKRMITVEVQLRTIAMVLGKSGAQAPLQKRYPGRSGTLSGEEMHDVPTSVLLWTHACNM